MCVFSGFYPSLQPCKWLECGGPYCEEGARLAGKEVPSHVMTHSALQHLNDPSPLAGRCSSNGQTGTSNGLSV